MPSACPIVAAGRPAPGHEWRGPNLGAGGFWPGRPLQAAVCPGAGPAIVARVRVPGQADGHPGVAVHVERAGHARLALARHNGSLGPARRYPHGAGRGQGGMPRPPCPPARTASLAKRPPAIRREDTLSGRGHHARRACPARARPRQGRAAPAMRLMAALQAPACQPASCRRLMRPILEPHMGRVRATGRLVRRPPRRAARRARHAPLALRVPVLPRARRPAWAPCAPARVLAGASCLPPAPGSPWDAPWGISPESRLSRDMGTGRPSSPGVRPPRAGARPCGRRPQAPHCRHGGAPACAAPFCRPGAIPAGTAHGPLDLFAGRADNPFNPCAMLARAADRAGRSRGPRAPVSVHGAGLHALHCGDAHCARRPAPARLAPAGVDRAPPTLAPAVRAAGARVRAWVFWPGVPVLPARAPWRGPPRPGLPAPLRCACRPRRPGRPCAPF